MDGDQTADIEFHLHAAARAFWANKWILCDKHVPLSLRVKFFEAVVTPWLVLVQGIVQFHSRISASWIPSGDDCLDVWLDHLRGLIGLCPGMKYYTAGISMSSR